MFKYTPQQQVPHNQEQSLPGQAASLPEKHNVEHRTEQIKSGIMMINLIQIEIIIIIISTLPLISFQNATNNC